MADVSLQDLADHLVIDGVTWSIRRNDELSGLGDGRILAAEMAPPLWSAEVTLCDMPNGEAKQVTARIRALHGSMTAFMLCDPASEYPQYDPDGSILGAAAVTVSAINLNARQISLAGLPSGYRITTGDKLQIPYAQGSIERQAFLEASETMTATGGGTISSLGVFPHVPPGVAEGNAVILARPALRCIIVPGSHNPGTVRSRITYGQSFNVVQKK